jgi:toxin ParE1/3/4
MKVYWTNTAVKHLLNIHEYIAVHSERYANTVIDRITKRADQFSNFPNSGRIVREFNTKEVREIIEGSYRIIYYVGLEQIEVLAVVNTAQELGSLGAKE